VCYLWASAGFVAYLLSYYTKYFKGNFYINFTIAGLTESFSMFWIGILSRKFKIKQVLTICYGLIIIQSIIMQILLYKLDDEVLIGIVPLMVFSIRL
jgi:hypothetical protein